MIVYVASPYTGPNRRKVQENIKAANEYGKQVYLLGHVPIVPHRISALWDYDSRLKHVKPEAWLDYLLPSIARRVRRAVPMWGVEKVGGMQYGFSGSVADRKDYFCGWD
jgi:hypothetical protein